MPTIALSHIKKVMAAMILLLSILLMTNQATAADTPKNITSQDSHSAPTIIKLHTFITHLYDLSPPTSSYKAIIWLSANQTKKTEGLLKHIEFIDAASESKMHTSSEENADGSYTEFAKYYLTLSHHFDLNHYPFDTQTMNIRIESPVSDIEKTQFTYATEETKKENIIHKTGLPEGWRLKSAKPTISIHHYQTNFGVPNQPEASNYAQLNIKLIMERENKRLFFSLFSMLYIAYVLSLLALLMPPNISFFPTTSGLLTGSVFSLIGNFIISNELLIHTLSFTLIDKVQILTLMLMLMTYLALIYNSYLAKANKIKKANQVRTISILGSIILYVSLNVIILTT